MLETGIEQLFSCLDITFLSGKHATLNIHIEEKFSQRLIHTMTLIRRFEICS